MWNLDKKEDEKMNKLEKIVEGVTNTIESEVNLVAISVMLAVPIIAINVAYMGAEAGVEAIQSRTEKDYKNVKLIDVKKLWGHNMYHTKGTFELPSGEKFYAYDNSAVLEGKFLANTILSNLKKDSTYDVRIVQGYICGTKVSTTIIDAE